MKLNPTISIGEKLLTEEELNKRNQKNQISCCRKFTNFITGFFYTTNRLRNKTTTSIRTTFSSIHERKLGVIKEVIQLKKLDEWDQFFKEVQYKIVNKSLGETLINYFQEEGKYIRIWRFSFSVFAVVVVYIYFFKNICVDLVAKVQDEKTWADLPVYKVYKLINLMYSIDCAISILQLFTTATKWRKIVNLLIIIPIKVIMSIPFSLTSYFWVSFKFFRLDLIHSLFQLMKEYCYMKIENKIHNNLLKVILIYLNEIFKYFLVFLLYAHFMTCIFAYIDKDQVLLQRGNWGKLDHEEYYILTLYSTFSTFTNVGYGEFVPFSNTTIFMYMVSMYFGYCLFIIIMINVKLLFSVIKYFKKKKPLRSDFEQFIFYLQRNRGVLVPKNLKNTMYSHVILRKALSYPEIYRTFPNLFKICRNDIKNEITTSLFDNLYKEYSVFFKNCSKDFAHKIFSKLIPKTFKPGKILIRANAKVNVLYFILSGEIKILTKEEFPFFEIKTSSILGDYSFFNGVSSEYIFQVSDKSFAVGFLLKKEDYLKIAEEDMASAREFVMKSFYKHYGYKETEKAVTEAYFRQSNIVNTSSSKRNSFLNQSFTNLLKSRSKIWDTVGTFSFTSSFLSKIEIKTNIIKEKINKTKKNIFDLEYNIYKFKSDLSESIKVPREKILQIGYELNKTEEAKHIKNSVKTLKDQINYFFNRDVIKQ